MKTPTAFWIAASCRAGLVGCTSLRTVDVTRDPATAPAPGARPALRPNDKVVIDTKDGKTLELQVISVDAQGLTGHNRSDGRETRVALAETDKIQRQDPEAGKTVGVIALGFAAMLAWVALVATSIF